MCRAVEILQCSLCLWVACHVAIIHESHGCFWSMRQRCDGVYSWVILFKWWGYLCFPAARREWITAKAKLLFQTKFHNICFSVFETPPLFMRISFENWNKMRDVQSNFKFRDRFARLLALPMSNKVGKWDKQLALFNSVRICTFKPP